MLSKTALTVLAWYFASLAAAGPTFSNRFSPGELRVYERVRSRPDDGLAAPRVSRVAIRCLDDDDDIFTLLISVSAAGEDGDSEVPAHMLVVRIDAYGRWDPAQNTPQAVVEQFHILQLFPLVGAPIHQGGRWQGPTDAIGRGFAFSLSDANATALDYRGVDPERVFAALGWNVTGTFAFADGRTRFARGRHVWTALDGTARVIFEDRLLKRAQLSDERLGQLRTAVRRLIPFQAWRRAAEQTQLARGLTTPDWSAVVRRLEEALRDTAPATVVHAYLRGQLQAARAAALESASAKAATPLVGEVARGWSLQAADGRTLRSEELRKGWVLEYFWGAEHLPSVAGWRHARGAAAQQPAVSFISYNTDPSPLVAARGAAALDNTAAHVLAEPLGFPPGFYRVLDPRRVVVMVGQGFRVNWEPVLAVVDPDAFVDAEPSVRTRIRFDD
jgi:hypothetical protein